MLALQGSRSVGERMMRDLKGSRCVADRTTLA